MKLTPTTNDSLHGNIPTTNGSSPKRRGRPKIVAAHEPAQEPGDVPWTTRGEINRAFDTTGTVVHIEDQKHNVAPVAEPAPLKVALIGTAPSSRMLAPFNDPTWKIWGCSPGNMNQLPRVDAWFEIHGNMLWPENKHYGEAYLTWLSQQTFPVYMQSRKWIPNATPLPMRELVNEFGPYFFSSSFSWMMAMAMKQGAKEIALYGIDMASRDEYILQRPGAYYFFSEGKKRGIKMSAPYESDIMQPPALYGFSEMTLMGRKLLARKKEVTDRVNTLRQQRDQAAQQVTYLEGACEDLDYTISIFGGAQNNSGAEQLGEET